MNQTKWDQTWAGYQFPIITSTTPAPEYIIHYYQFKWEIYFIKRKNDLFLKIWQKGLQTFSFYYNNIFPFSSYKYIVPIRNQFIRSWSRKYCVGTVSGVLHVCSQHKLFESQTPRDSSLPLNGGFLKDYLRLVLPLEGIKVFSFRTVGFQS